MSALPAGRPCWSPAPPASSAAGWSQALASAGHQVIVLARNPAKAATLHAAVPADHRLVAAPDDTHIDAIVNLAGEPIAQRAVDRCQAPRILASRLRMTGNVVRLIQRLAAQACGAGERLGDRLVRPHEDEC